MRDLWSAFHYRWCCKVPLVVRTVVRTGETRVRCTRCKTEMTGRDRAALEAEWNEDVERRRPPKAPTEEP